MEKAASQYVSGDFELTTVRDIENYKYQLGITSPPPPERQCKNQTSPKSLDKRLLGDVYSVTPSSIYNPTMDLQGPRP